MVTLLQEYVACVNRGHIYSNTVSEGVPVVGNSVHWTLDSTELCCVHNLTKASSLFVYEGTAGTRSRLYSPSS